MTNQLETVITGFIAVAASAMGSKTARMIADVTNAPMPDWMTWLVGPLGALVGLIIALKWMSARLDKAEQKADQKEQARDKEQREERDRLIVALERSTVAMDSVKSVIAGCHVKISKQSEPE